MNVKLVRDVLYALEKYGPLCLSQLYTILDASPASVAVVVRDLLERGHIEVREKRTVPGLEEELRVYALRTGGRVADGAPKKPVMS